MHDHDDETDRIDALVRAASARDTNAEKLRRAVNDRLDAQAGARVFLRPFFTPRLAVAGFATMLLAAGFGGYHLPGLATGDPDESMLLLAMGAPTALDDPIVAFFVGADR